MYLFQISNYDDPAVDRETAELLHRHLEAESRRRCPAMWNAMDSAFTTRWRTARRGTFSKIALQNWR